MSPTNSTESVLLFEKQSDWVRWLAKNHGTSSGVWLRLAKKSSGKPSVTYAEAVDTALCQGWIDGQKKSDNEQYWLQKFTPRTTKSIWSKINRDRVLLLIERGEMKAAGLKEVERAKDDGRWASVYDSAKTAQVPDDFQDALDLNKKAKDFFDTLSGQNRYAVLFRIQTAKKPETRNKRIQAFIHMLENHEKLYP